jgi:hypothetical protein
MYLIQVSLLLISQQGLVDFFWYQLLLPIGWSIVQILHQRRRKTNNTAKITGAIQTLSQSTSINEQITPLVISRNDKNKQLSLLSQRKLTLLTSINKLFAL